MNPAITTGPRAANRQDCRLNLAACPDTCGFFASMISRGGRGLPFARSPSHLLTTSTHGCGGSSCSGPFSAPLGAGAP